MYATHTVKIYEKDVSKLRDILKKRYEARDIESWCFSTFNKDIMYCYIEPIVSDDMKDILNEIKQAGIQII